MPLFFHIRHQGTKNCFLFTVCNITRLGRDFVATDRRKWSVFEISPSVSTVTITALTRFNGIDLCVTVPITVQQLLEPVIKEYFPNCIFFLFISMLPGWKLELARLIPPQCLNARLHRACQGAQSGALDQQHELRSTKHVQQSNWEIQIVLLHLKIHTGYAMMTLWFAFFATPALCVTLVAYGCRAWHSLSINSRRFWACYCITNPPAHTTAADGTQKPRVGLCAENVNKIIWH